MEQQHLERVEENDLAELAPEVEAPSHDHDMHDDGDVANIVVEESRASKVVRAVDLPVLVSRHVELLKILAIYASDAWWIVPSEIHEVYANTLIHFVLQ